MLRHWIWFIGLMIFELVLAMWLSGANIPPETLNTWPWAAIAEVAPVITNFAAIPGVNAGIPIYLAITLLLTPLKIAFWVIILRSNGGNYAQWVPSPRYRTESKIGEYLLGKTDTPSSAAMEKRDVDRFNLRGCIVSILVVLFSIACFLIVLSWGRTSPYDLSATRASYVQIAAGGISLWLSWGFRNLFAAFVGAVVLLIFHQYWLLIRSLISRSVSNHG